MGRIQIAPDGHVDGGLRLWRPGQPAQLLDGPPPWTCDSALGDTLRLADATSDEVEWVVGATASSVALRPGVQLRLAYRGPWDAVESMRAGYLRVTVSLRRGSPGTLVATLTPGGGAVSAHLSVGTVLSLPTTDRTLAVGSLGFELFADVGSRSLGTARLASLQLGAATTLDLKEHPAQRAVRHQVVVTLAFEPFQRSPISGYRHLFVLEARTVVAPDCNLVARVSLPPTATLVLESPLALSNSGAEWAWHWVVPLAEVPAQSTLALSILDATCDDATVATCDLALSETPAWVPLTPRGELLVVAAREAFLTTVRLTRLCNLPATTKTVELRCGGDVVLQSTQPLIAHCSSALACVACNIELSVCLDEPILNLSLLLDDEVRLSRVVCAASSATFDVALSSAIRVGFGSDTATYEPSPRHVWISLVTPDLSVVVSWDGQKHALSQEMRLELRVDDSRTAVLVLEAADTAQGYIYGEMLTDSSVATPWQGPVALVLGGSVVHEVVCSIASQPFAYDAQQDLFSDVTSPVQYVPGPGTLYLQLTSPAAVTMRIAASKWSATHVPPSSRIMAVPLHWSPSEKPSRASCLKLPTHLRLASTLQHGYCSHLNGLSRRF
ncbi:hypothetical protein SPRG_15154 [Saprolegnia parasitica CBS 223.65]|uniref:Uncharacterized protein n=1 Tax=Saprolegnia parasitica (strain CBS 223.65) TaxID=695850 RepID=A0A067BMW7_SAPPC|nr:hypothetical protein SPRG_15154 [Saprolegnia parasitica CBS 223.65]KDO19573.1 hypothetical protein SPRG_15154 [Saprolegnia parasitica CBS 223.65]|eukprot:XP_012209721.1 hypothetical protein SPRG_15154 [Saprolegnia parasitica CBS 223.65]